MKIEFKNIGPHLGTRIAGASERKKIETAITNGDKVIFDFSGVETVSNSFADECLAKLLFSFELEKVKASTTFINASPFIKAVIANAFKVRQSQMTAAA